MRPPSPPPAERRRPLTRANEVDFTGDARPVLCPSPDPPGSPGRVDAMRDRYRRRQDLFCARDRRLAEGDGYEGAESGGVVYRRKLLERQEDGSLKATQENAPWERQRRVRPSDERTALSRAKDALRKAMARRKAAAEREARGHPRHKLHVEAMPGNMAHWRGVPGSKDQADRRGDGMGSTAR